MRPIYECPENCMVAQISRRLRKNLHITILTLFSGEIIFEVFQPMWSRYLNVTGGQTDGQYTVASPHSNRQTKYRRYYRYRWYFKLKIPVCYRHIAGALQTVTWNVLQNEDEHRLLDSADTKYDALITHSKKFWALKTTQNHNFAALFTNKAGGVLWLSSWSSSNKLMIMMMIWCDVIRKEAKH